MSVKLICLLNLHLTLAADRHPNKPTNMDRNISSSAEAITACAALKRPEQSQSLHPNV